MASDASIPTPEEQPSKSFDDLGLSDELLRAVKDAGYEKPTPIQAKAIPYVLMGRDILGCAQTGTGKTAGFTLPMIDILAHGRAKARMPRSLILEPTRELAAQVADNFETYGKYHKLSKALLIGGSSMDEQLKVLNRGADVLIATPGRLLDVFERGHLLMADVKILVIDEADRMLDMGFIPDVERIVKMLPTIRTTLFFSATMPPEIRKLADKFLMNPKEISVSAPASTADTIKQRLVMVDPKSFDRRPGAAQKAKRATLRKLIDSETEMKNALIFCNRKRDVDIVYRSLERHGYGAERLHGDMAQPERMKTLARFKTDDIKILVCSDVAARGLDVQGMSHVFNFDVPTHAEDYVHRIGRTGRAGRQGSAFTIALPEDGKYVQQIERLIGKPIPRDTDVGSGEVSASADDVASPDEGRGRGRRRGGGRGRDRAPKDRPQEPRKAEEKKPEEAPQPAAEEPRRDDKREQAKPRDERKREDRQQADRKPADRNRDDKGRNGRARDDNRRGRDNDRDDDRRIKGMGEYTPDFLKQPLPKIARPRTGTDDDE